MKAKQFIVTGANGFLGSNLITQLLSDGHQVIGLILEDNAWSRDTTHPNLHFKKIDVTDAGQLDSFFEAGDYRQSIVVHTAGIVSIDNSADSALTKVNVTGTENVIRTCKKHSCLRLVYVSSVHAIPELPNNQMMSEIQTFDPELVVGGYAKTKAIATQLAVEARKDGLEVTIVHPSGMIGPGDFGNSNIKQAIVDYLNRKLTAMVDGGYDFVDVRDVVQGIISASILPIAKNQNYILSGHQHSMRHIIDIVDQMYPSKKHRLTRLPYWFLRPLAALAELWYKLRKVAPTFTRYSIHVLDSNANFSHQKATTELNYQPRPIEDTVRDAVAWYQQQGLIGK